MRYLIIIENRAFITEWYSYENNYVPGMIVIDRKENEISFDGKVFYEIEDDHL